MYTFALITYWLEDIIMKLSKWTLVVLAASAIITLTSCSHRRMDQMASANGYHNGALASGLGHESGFGEDANGKRLASSKNLYYFDFDSYTVRDSDKPAMKASAEYLATHPNTKVMLEGH